MTIMDILSGTVYGVLTGTGVLIVLGLSAQGLISVWAFLEGHFRGPATDPLRGVVTCADLSVVSVERLSRQSEESYVVVLRSPKENEFHVRVTTASGHPLYSQDADLNVSLYHQHHSDLARMLIARAEGVVKGQVWESAEREVLLERGSESEEKGLPC